MREFPTPTQRTTLLVRLRVRDELSVDSTVGVLVPSTSGGSSRQFLFPVRRSGGRLTKSPGQFPDGTDSEAELDLVPSSRMST